VKRKRAFSGTTGGISNAIHARLWQKADMVWVHGLIWRGTFLGGYWERLNKVPLWSKLSEEPPVLKGSI
jgi:hypothetical protein